MLLFCVLGAIQISTPHLEEAVQRSSALHGGCQRHHAPFGPWFDAALALVADPGGHNSPGGLCSHHYAFQISQ